MVPPQPWAFDPNLHDRRLDKLRSYKRNKKLSGFFIKNNSRGLEKLLPIFSNRQASFKVFNSLIFITNLQFT